ncbi:hypothetical protein DAPPUDRAFT_241913 [Daphnia pulex]|uniref:Uncharacterized protein n=1 Tax=Daphnia pulex TaxID=6669 RepID=E9GFD2_DAPPU|nr:hypothetical protein DAPPUDRAFT_241913 [Daphnia pulex]|eukprot:EFX81831.1 hypothetical protein DAPPUDRAFT_241913 [Daphnia pulex]
MQRSMQGGTHLFKSIATVQTCAPPLRPSTLHLCAHPISLQRHLPLNLFGENVYQIDSESSSSTKRSSRRFYFNDLNAKMSMALLAPSFHHLKKPPYRYPYYDVSGKGHLYYGYGGSDLYTYNKFTPLEGIYRK